MTKKTLSFILIFALSAVFTADNCATAKKQHPPKLPIMQYTLAKYNDYPGLNELNFKDITQQRQINTQGVISPNRRQMVYSEIYYYPQLNRISSSIYNIDLKQSRSTIRNVMKASIKDRDNSPLLTTGLNSSESQIFRTLTVVDWSADGSKLLIKEKAGETQGGIWATYIWVYDFKTQTASKIAITREAVKHFWEANKGINLEKYRWDVNPIGWDLYNPTRIVFDAYGYDKSERKFLGTFSTDYYEQTTLLLTLEEKKDIKVSKNGLVMVKKLRQKAKELD